MAKEEQSKVEAEKEADPLDGWKPKFPYVEMLAKHSIIDYPNGEGAPRRLREDVDRRIFLPISSIGDLEDIRRYRTERGFKLLSFGNFPRDRKTGELRSPYDRIAAQLEVIVNPPEYR